MRVPPRSQPSGPASHHEQRSVPVGEAARNITTSGGARDDEGQVLLLILGYTIVLLSLVLVLATATSVHIARSRLVTLADAAALDAADAMSGRVFYDPQTGGLAGSDGSIPVGDAGVRSAVAAYLARSPASSRLGEVRIAEPTGTADGRTAEVTLAATAPIPVLGGVLAAWSDGIDLTVTSHARATSE